MHRTPGRQPPRLFLHGLNISDIESVGFGSATGAVDSNGRGFDLAQCTGSQNNLGAIGRACAAARPKPRPAPVKRTRFPSNLKFGAT